MKTNHLNKLKPAVLASLLLALGVSANAQLVHRYDFSTGANDSVGSANGTLEGGATVSGGSLTTPGFVAGGLSGGVPQNGLLLPGSAVAGITGSFTIETWFNASYGGGYSTLFSFSDSTTANYILATPARGNFPYASTISAIGGGGNVSEQQAGGQYQDNGVLHDMVVTYDGTTLSYYLDGALATFPGQPGVLPTITDVGLNLSSLTYIGVNGGSPWPDNSINGSTLDFRIYGQSLTSGQVTSVFGLGSDATTASIVSAITPAPEPSVLALAGLGGLGMLTLAARRGKKS